MGVAHKAPITYIWVRHVPQVFAHANTRRCPVRCFPLLSALQHPYTIIFFNTNNTYHHVSNSPYNYLVFVLVLVLELPTNVQYCLEQLQETNEEGST